MEDDRDAPGRRRILEAAKQVIASDGEAALRILDIAAEAEVAQGLISHHFGSRDGLVAAAQRERFAGETDRDRERLMRLVGSAPTREQFVAGIAKVTRDAVRRPGATRGWTGRRWSVRPTAAPSTGPSSARSSPA